MCMLLESAYSKWWFDDYDHEDKNETASLKLNNDNLNDVMPSSYISIPINKVNINKKLKFETWPKFNNEPLKVIQRNVLTLNKTC